MLECVSKAFGNETKEQRDGFLVMLLGTLGASILRDMLISKRVIRVGEGTIRGRRDL